MEWEVVSPRRMLLWVRLNLGSLSVKLTMGYARIHDLHEDGRDY